MSGKLVIKLRGLPWSTTVDDVIKFLDGCRIKNGINGIHIVSRGGRVRGEAFVELESERDVDVALSKHREHIGTRYIEVFRSSGAEMSHMLSSKSSDWKEPVVRLRGVPYYCTKNDIYDFFSGLQIAHNGVYISTNEAGEAVGVAYVAFTKMEIAYRALEMHRKPIGHRYVEVFQSTYAEARNRMMDDMELNGELASYTDDELDHPLIMRSSRPLSSHHRPSPYDSLPSLESPSYLTHSVTSLRKLRDRRSPVPRFIPHNVIMTGLPYRCTEDEIYEFFKPLRPMSVRLLCDSHGKPVGEAVVEFETHDEACEAMKFDKQFIGSRYVDLMLESTRPTDLLLRNSRDSRDFLEPRDFILSSREIRDYRSRGIEADL